MTGIDITKLFQENRLKTFTNWIFKSNSNVACIPLKMAEAGFYFIGNADEPDLVKCFICLKQLDGWNEQDDPFKEHKKHAPYCPFVKLGKKESDIKVYDMIDLGEEMVMKQIQEEFEAGEKIIKEKNKELKKRVIALAKKQKI